MSSVSITRPHHKATWGTELWRYVVGWGELADFTFRTLGWMITRRPSKGTLLPIFFQVGVRSVSVVGITGLFIGMVLAVQGFGEFTRFPPMKGWLGAAINGSVIRELGPVLAATMLAGRVGSAIAAELGTMRVTEQIDALSTLSTNPMKFMVAPRLIAGVTMLPLLVVIADIIGVFGGYLVAVYKLGFNPANYLQSTFDALETEDVVSGLVKAAVFGLIVTLMGCYHGYTSRGGAQGVGAATTNAVVSSAILILCFDYILTELFFSR